ncbi:MAG: DUF3575 domain-containing protein [Bacteroidota bacterium]
MIQRYYVLLLLCCLVTVAFAQETDSKVEQSLKGTERQDAIKLNLLSPFYGTVNLAWQHRLSNDASFQLTMTYTDFDSYGSTDNTQTNNSVGNGYRYENTSVENQLTRGFTIVPEYRFVLNGRGLSGIYIAPFARYMYYEYSRDIEVTIDSTFSSYPIYSYSASERYTYQSVGVGVIVGKQLIFKNRVVLDFFGGPVYSILLTSNHSIAKTSDVVIGSGIPNMYIRGYGVRGGFSVGFLF